MTGKEMKLLAKASSVLDKLQVELCDDTPYPIPSNEEIRNRILKAMDYIDEMLPDYEDVEE